MRPAAIPDFERDYHESLLIVLDTLEKCLSMQANMHPSSHGAQYNQVYSTNRVGRGPPYQGLKISRPAVSANTLQNLHGPSSITQGAAVQGGQNESTNSTKEKEVNTYKTNVKAIKYFNLCKKQKLWHVLTL